MTVSPSSAEAVRPVPVTRDNVVEIRDRTRPAPASTEAPEAAAEPPGAGPASEEAPAEPETRQATGSEPVVPTASSTPVKAPEIPAGVRRVEVSKRGKRDFNYSWPKVDVAVMREAWETYRPLYRRYWADRDPGGAYRLVFSAFVAHALQVAFEDMDAWVDTIRNDARKQPVEGGREQVGLVWPVEVENRIIDVWETFDKSRLPAGFSLTKQHLAAAAILYGLRTANEWYPEVGNDDRFSIPVESDGRLRMNRGTGAESDQRSPTTG